VVRRFVCVVKPFKLDAAIEALKRFDVGIVTIEEVRGYGRQKGHLELYQGSEYNIAFLPKVRLEFFAPAERTDSIIEALMNACRTGRIGDGKIFIQDCESPAHAD